MYELIDLLLFESRFKKITSTILMLRYISKKEVNGSPNNTLLSGILLKCNNVLTNLTTVIVTRKLTAIKSQQSLLKRVLVKGGGVSFRD